MERSRHKDYFVCFLSSFTRFLPFLLIFHHTSETTRWRQTTTTQPTPTSSKKNNIIIADGSILYTHTIFFVFAFLHFENFECIRFSLILHKGTPNWKLANSHAAAQQRNMAKERRKSIFKKWKCWKMSFQMISFAGTFTFSIFQFLCWALLVDGERRDTMWCRIRHRVVETENVIFPIN